MERMTPTLLMIFDYFAAMLAGCASAVLVAVFIQSGWPISVGMFTGMLLGMIVLVISVLALGWVGGVFEIVMPGMFIVMIVGMVCGMSKTSGNADVGQMVMFGLVTGLVIQSVFHLYNKSLHGEVLRLRGDTEKE
ncbi:MAG: hypothetical protein IEMM0002_0291 [bacterium]|nr:MAG: hypothetical protein IEMM0002_0291 [bacterium]